VLHGVPEMYQKKKKKTDTLKALITIPPLQSSPFGSVHNDPNISAMIGRCPGSPFVSVFSTFCNSTVSILCPFNLTSFWGGGRSHSGLIQVTQGGGNNCQVFKDRTVAHQSCVCRRIVMMQHPVVHVPLVWPLRTHVLPILPQDVTVDLCNDGVTRRDKFLMDNHINVKKSIWALTSYCFSLAALSSARVKMGTSTGTKAV